MSWHSWLTCMTSKKKEKRKKNNTEAVEPVLILVLIYCSKLASCPSTLGFCFLWILSSFSLFFCERFFEDFFYTRMRKRVISWVFFSIWEICYEITSTNNGIESKKLKLISESDFIFKISSQNQFVFFISIIILSSERVPLYRVLLFPFLARNFFLVLKWQVIEREG